MAFALSIFFEAYQQGWSENFYVDAANHAGAITKGKAYVTQRRKSLSSYASIKHLRATDTLPPRDAAFFTYTGGTGQGTYAAPANDDTGDEAVMAAVNYRLFAGNSLWRSLLVRGLPQDAIRQFATSEVGQAWRTAFDQAFQAMKDNTLQLRKKGLGASALVTGVGIVNNKIHNFVVNAIPAGLVAGDVIQIDYVLNIRNVNSRYRVRIVDPATNTVSVAPKQIVNQGAYLPGTGILRKVTYTYATITEAQVVTISSRKTGRPSYQPRGRRSVQRT